MLVAKLVIIMVIYSQLLRLFLTGQQTILCKKFGDNSPDLSGCVSIYEVIKKNVYWRNPRIDEGLENEIQRVISEITQVEL